LQNKNISTIFGWFERFYNPLVLTTPLKADESVPKPPYDYGRYY